MKRKSGSETPASTPPRSKAAAPAAHPGKRATAKPPPFFIVGIGASAGGLEALAQFLEAIPADSGMAFVVVQHLDPTHPGILPELLQHSTVLPVVQVGLQMRVRPDSVYVIPPNKDLTIRHGVLHLQTPTAPRGHRLPIDAFLTSLAVDRQERSVGVILSGMGADGTLGARAIKAKAGLVAAQELATAKFDAMPRSIVDAGLADIVAAAADLPGRIIALLHRAPPDPATESEGPPEGDSAKAVQLLRAHTGHDFSLYKKNTLRRRIERRMGIHRIRKMSAYVEHLQQNSQELDLLFREMLIGVTQFFRDPSAWEQLCTETIPALLAGRTSGEPSGHGFPAARPARRPTRWPSPSRRQRSEAAPSSGSPCRSSPPISTAIPSTRHAGASIRRPSPPR